MGCYIQMNKAEFPYSCMHSQFCNLERVGDH